MSKQKPNYKLTADECAPLDQTLRELKERRPSLAEVRFLLKVLDLRLKEAIETHLTCRQDVLISIL